MEETKIFFRETVIRLLTSSMIGNVIKEVYKN